MTLNVNGKSAIEWITDRCQVTRDPASAIPNDPNDCERERIRPDPCPNRTMISVRRPNRP